MRALSVFCASVNNPWATKKSKKNLQKSLQVQIFAVYLQSRSAGKFFEAEFLCGNSSVGRARPCQGRGREFESRFPLQNGNHLQQCGWLFSFKERPKVDCPNALKSRILGECLPQNVYPTFVLTAPAKIQKRGFLDKTRIKKMFGGRHKQYPLFPRQSYYRKQSRTTPQRLYRVHPILTCLLH